jgi:ubiquinone/menaquinone biosynthesis C-methylase UbiE
VLPGGTIVGIDIQARMLDRLKARAAAANVTNLATILGDATQPIVPAASFDVTYLAAALGEIPDRAAALAQCFQALKSGGVLSITEMQPDPHYQSKDTIKRLAEAAGFKLQSIQGGMWLYTANFLKP